jgi:CheY-like chemotaxis protein
MPQKIKAVVIDDDLFCREFIAEILADRGYWVASYATAHSLPFCNSKGDLCQCEHACAELLLTDNQMPRLTGLEMIEQQQAKGCKLTAGNRAVISGSWSPKERQKAQQLGCQTFVKPYDLKGIDDWLSACEGRF